LLGAAVRPTAANNEFYLRAKASVGEDEAIIQDEKMPGTADEIVRQTQEFQHDITLCEWSEIYENVCCLPHSRPSDANFTCTAHSLGTRNNCYELVVVSVFGNHVLRK